ncbi:MAG: hypothetical protein ACK5LR_08335 [Mangrovibacterium sp.]
MKVIKVRVEKNSTGEYWGNTINSEVIVSACGANLNELKKELQDAFDFAIEDLPNAKEFEDIQFEYLMDLESFFTMIPQIKIGKIAEKANINASLMRQYATGKAYASESRLRQIESSVHDLGSELLSVSF